MLCLRDVFCAAVRPLAVLGFIGWRLAAIPIAAQNVPQPINLSSAVGGGSNPVMAFDANGGINVAWVGSGVFFARSTDGGATFSTTTVIPLSFPPLGVQMGIDAAGNIELLWPTSPDDTHPGGRAFLSRSTDGGMTFSAAGEFAPPAGVTSSAIQLAVESTGAIDVIWQDQARANLFFARSTDGGLNFSAPLSRCGARRRTWRICTWRAGRAIRFTFSGRTFRTVRNATFCSAERWTQAQRFRRRPTFQR